MTTIEEKILKLQQVVCGIHGITEEELYSERRYSNVAFGRRNMTIFLLAMGISPSEQERRFGDIAPWDHSSVDARFKEGVKIYNHRLTPMYADDWKQLEQIKALSGIDIEELFLLFRSKKTLRAVVKLFNERKYTRAQLITVIDRYREENKSTELIVREIEDNLQMHIY